MISMTLGTTKCRKGLVRVKIVSTFPQSRSKVRAYVDCCPEKVWEDLELAGWHFSDADCYGHDDRSYGFRRCLMDSLPMAHTVVTGISS